MIPFTEQDLFSLKQQRTFPRQATEAKFLLGGIGTGNVSVGSRGQLCDWEIFNSQGKGNKLPHTFFAIRTQQGEQQPIAKVLESQLAGSFSSACGFYTTEIAGLPRFEASEMKGEYPFVTVDLKDNALPVSVQMEAFTPFIPLNADDSGIPGAVIRYKVKNTTKAPVDVSIAGSLANVVGLERIDHHANVGLAKQVRNQYREESQARGLYYDALEMESDHKGYGSMAIMTAAKDITVKEEWLDGYWSDGIHDFWDDFCEDGLLKRHSEAQGIKGRLMTKSKLRIGSLGMKRLLQPHEEHVFEFVIAWHFPNRPKRWEGGNTFPDDGRREIELNYYTNLFEDAWHAGVYLLSDLKRLEGHSRDFHQAIFGSTLPDYVLDALTSNLTVLRSTTCFRIQNGTFLGWEGGLDHNGSCEGSCTHVWNYAQSLAFLFPELERTMRRVEFLLETDEQGSMAFRTNQVLGGERWDMIPATDGQMGTIVRLYREWKLSGDDTFLREVWEKASLALDFAFTYWDSDGDFVLDSEQHNTYDIEFQGPNSHSNSMFYAALKAGMDMARHLGDNKRAERYQYAFEQGSRKMDEQLWGGEYYIQQLNDIDEYRYQYGIGCLSDQLIGQFMAHVAGLGYILPEEHVKQAIYSIFKYNFRTDFTDHHNVQRTFALNDEMGLLLCSWPHGGRPKLPFVYSDEVWTGIEYQVAAHLIYEGFVCEGLTLVKSVRNRHDGFKRNPWNEAECGHHYARSMASWALLTSLSGYSYDMVNRTLSFAPKINADHFRTFWSTGTAWGIYKQSQNMQTGELEWTIKVLYGELNNVEVNGVRL
ncbi:GH116 family glycosyl-hydrolase [Bacillus sp. FJAT-28004]|uniref:GH116 family glycosyl-hydrolase n=1 Tax=Bacillus sp. FJAT-28004 TaxID=1679165 RepID=UPI0006B64EC1|nr:GH116 family glycosyl-hydrolase [Bacillus sp. FJAT-28004]